MVSRFQQTKQERQCDYAGEAHAKKVKRENTSQVFEPVLPLRDSLSEEVAGSDVTGDGTDVRWDPVRHFKHQVAFIRQLIPIPREWDVILGALGSGIVGVRERCRRPVSGPRCSKRRKSFGSRSGSVRSSSLAKKKATTNLRSSTTAEPLSTDSRTFIILFMNGKGSSLQQWHGRSLSNFASSFNKRNRTLTWESQRRDKKGRIIASMLDKVQAGAEIVVAVRATVGESYTILGRTQKCRLKAQARFLIDNGEHVVVERGSSRVHKAILARCLDDGLKAGIGLMPLKYPLPKNYQADYCGACCWAPATALLTFDEYDKKAAAVLGGSQVRGESRPRTRAKPKKLPTCDDERKAAAIRRRWRRSRLHRHACSVVKKRLSL
eukprot:TRINITY_DN20191_c0_g2_i1.p1 TRINITY_DN20191_c0_g2~~TRINITY_DN20191_c0_g2_i1.p1  ORF type:complete len:379 (+),score=44.55 TRINITY_DN20191_c0_g2_i1:312-1448(+)